MLPFLQQTIDARKLLIYSDHSSQHPTNAAELTNNTGKTLDGGPITVYDGGAYGGEALMETLKAGDKRLISYAVDLGTRITDAFGSNRPRSRANCTPAAAFSPPGWPPRRPAPTPFATSTRRPKTLIIEHPMRHGYTLLNQKPTEKTATRLPLRVAAGRGRDPEVSGQRGAGLRADLRRAQPDAGRAG